MITPSVIQLNIDQKSSPLYTCMCIFSFMINKRVQNNSIEQKVLTSSIIAPGWSHTVASSAGACKRLPAAGCTFSSPHHHHHHHHAA